MRRLLTDGGYQAATIPAVARAAGVGAPTIYRRWSSQSAMVESALSAHLAPPNIKESGDFGTYLQRFVTSVVAYVADPATRAAVPGLLVEYYREPGHYTKLVERAEEPMRDLFRDAHASAVDDGAIASEPQADALFDAIIGMALYHGVWRHSADDRLIEEILGVIHATVGLPRRRRRRLR